MRNEAENICGKLHEFLSQLEPDRKNARTERTRLNTTEAEGRESRIPGTKKRQL